MKNKLKNKISVDAEFLKEFIDKSWLEIDQLLSISENIESYGTNNELSRLFKNLLTSYYVFVGGLETLSEGKELQPAEAPVVNTPINNIAIEDNIETTIEALPVEGESIYEVANIVETTEPFEYFVDFDEPTGEPLTDEDLYN